MILILPKMVLEVEFGPLDGGDDDVHYFVALVEIAKMSVMHVDFVFRPALCDSV